MFKKFSIFFFTIFLFNFANVAESANAINHAKLENGLDVYVVSNNRIPAALHSVIYKVGGMDDPVGKAGLAHYFEHLMFETTGKFTNIDSIMSNIGAESNAFTTKEYTCYYEQVLKKDLPLAMEVEADRMGSFNVTQDKINREKNIVLEERKMRVDNHPHALLREEMDNAFYRTGYGKPVVGWENDINKFNQDDIIKFHDDYYHSGNAILLIVGDVQFDEVLDLARKKYGNIKSKSTVRHYPNEEPLYNANLSVTLKHSEVKEPVLRFRYKVPVPQHIKEIYVSDLIAHILGGGKSSRLYGDLVLDEDIAVSTYAYHNGLTFTSGYIEIVVVPKSGVDINLIEEKLENSIKKFISEGITNEKLKSTKYKYKMEQLDNLSSLHSIAYFYGSHLALEVPLEDIDISYSHVNNISLEDINSKIRIIFSANKLVGHLLPKRDNNENK